ncbi:hypothetical protein GCM10020331_012150 [Ectobacillus funiculus]
MKKTEEKNVIVHSNINNNVNVTVIDRGEEIQIWLLKSLHLAFQRVVVPKTTSSGITAYLLSQEHKVLCLDMDGQGNLTSFLTGEFDICGVYEGKTTLEAIMDEDVSSYIVQITDNLHLVPSNDYLASLPRRMFEEKKGTSALSKALAPVFESV